MSKRGGSDTCHVCSQDVATGLYLDPDGNFLQACDRASCTVGYTFCIPMELFRSMLRWFSSSKNAAETRTHFPVTTSLRRQAFQKSKSSSP